MRSLYTRSALKDKLTSTYADPAALQDSVANPQMPKDLLDWLTQLGLLHGVPFNYLVPDEKMLPPESIRFFYLDMNWTQALADGAMSIGRNLTPDTDSPEMNLHKAVMPTVTRQVTDNTPHIRARAFGIEPTPLTAAVISGFLLRSSLVLDYPSMGVNVYPLGGTPNDPNPVMLTILRLEQLGPTSDTLICLVSGDAYRVDIHEAPQALHYGIDCYMDNCKVKNQNGDEVPVTARKDLYTFGNTTTTEGGVTTNSVTMSKTPAQTDISSCFRANSRVLEMSTLASVILAKNTAAGPPPGTTAPTSIDSAEMGFEMTQGVGMVSFFKSTT